MPGTRHTVVLLMIFFVCVSVSRAQDLEHIAKKPPVKLMGNFSAGLNYHANLSHKDSNARKTSFGSSPAYFLQSSPVISIYGFAIPINVMVTSQNSAFNTPFSRFGLSPYYKWAKLHLGWRSLNFSQFTLSGQEMLGAGFELTPGKFRAAFMYGKFNKALTNLSLYNNLNNNTPLYKRTGYAAKLGYGSSANFIEFSYLQAKDDSSSIPYSDSVSLRPAANQVAGLKGQLTLFKALSVSAELAASYYTRDLSGSLLETDNEWKKFASLQPRNGSVIAFAGEAGINYQLKSGNVNLKYRRVDPGYKSMGAFYMQTDIEQYTAGFNYSFLKNKIRLQSNFGWQRNNLADISANDSKRTIGNIGISIMPSPAFGMDIQYSNYGISQQVIPQLDDPGSALRYDSIRISQVNQSLSFSPHFFISRENIQHSFSLQTSFQLLHNNNDAMSDQDFTSTMSSLMYTAALTRQKINITGSLNYFNTVLTDNKTATLGYNLGVSKSIIPATGTGDRKSFVKSVNISLFGGYFSNSLNGSSSGNTVSLNPAVGFVFLGKHSLQFTMNYNSTKQNSGVDAAHKQLFLSTRYNVSF